MDYKKAVQLIIDRRRNETTQGELAYIELIKQNQTLALLDRNYRKSCLDFSPEAEKTQKEYKQKIQEYLKKENLYSIVYPPAHCKTCNDTGYDNGKYCTCVKSSAIASEDISFTLHSFSQSDVSIFKENAKCYESTQTVLETFCKKMPNTRIKTIVLSGKTGTGKTFLASCVADALIKKNLSVVFITAFEACERMLKYHTTFDSTKLSFLAPLIDCDMLIIDDVGSESIYKNVTKEYFFHIINERRLSNKPTMLTTNLTIDELGLRYGERTVSRIFDKSVCYAKDFDFSDKRIINIKN